MLLLLKLLSGYDNVTGSLVINCFEFSYYRCARIAMAPRVNDPPDPTLLCTGPMTQDAVEFHEERTYFRWLQSDYIYPELFVSLLELFHFFSYLNVASFKAFVSQFFAIISKTDLLREASSRHCSICALPQICINEKTSSPS